MSKPTAKLECAIREHTKWASLSDSAFRLGIETLLWAYEPDTKRVHAGFVPRNLLQRLARRPLKAAEKLAGELVAAGAPNYKTGLWEARDDGWMIHDFEKYSSAQEALSKAEAGRIGGRRSAESRKTGRPSVQPQTGPSNSLKQAEANGQANHLCFEAEVQAEPQANGQAGLFAHWGDIGGSPSGSDSASYSGEYSDQPDGLDQEKSDFELGDEPEAPEDVPEVKIDVLAVVPGKTRKTGPSPEVIEVFEFWKTETNHLKAKFDRKRANRIAARLRDGFKVEELCQAIRNRKNDPFLMGQNDTGKIYDDLESLLRDAAKVERLLETGSPLRPKQLTDGQMQGETPDEFRRRRLRERASRLEADELSAPQQPPLLTLGDGSEAAPAVYRAATVLEARTLPIGRSR